MNPVGAPGEIGCCLVTQAQYEGLEQLWVGGKGTGEWRVDPQPQGLLTQPTSRTSSVGPEQTLPGTEELSPLVETSGFGDKG